MCVCVCVCNSVSSVQVSPHSTHIARLPSPGGRCGPNTVRVCMLKIMIITKWQTFDTHTSVYHRNVDEHRVSGLLSQ